MARLKARDCAAVTVLYDNYSASLYGVVLCIVRCEQTAEDVLQETIVKAWACFASYDPTRGRLFTWLLNIARHAAIDAVRAPHYRRGLLTQDITEVSAFQGRTAHSSLNPDCIGIRELTETLRPEQRQVIDLMYFGGYTQSEVAERLSLPLGTVKSRARSAVKALRKLFPSLAKV